MNSHKVSFRRVDELAKAAHEELGKG